MEICRRSTTVNEKVAASRSPNWMPLVASALPKLVQVIVPSSSGSTSAAGQVLLSVSDARTLLVGPMSVAWPSVAATCASSATLMNNRSDSSARLPDGCTRIDTLLTGCSGRDDASALTGSATK